VSSVDNLQILQLQPFNGPLSRTTQVSRYQTGKNSLDFTEARDSQAWARSWNSWNFKMCPEIPEISLLSW